MRCHGKKQFTNWEFPLLLYKEVNHKKWCPVQVPLAGSDCMVVCTETRTPGCLYQINNQTFNEVEFLILTLLVLLLIP